MLWVPNGAPGIRRRQPEGWDPHRHDGSRTRPQRQPQHWEKAGGGAEPEDYTGKVRKTLERKGKRGGWMDAKAETITQSVGSGPCVRRCALGVMPGSQPRLGTRSQGNCRWQQRCGAQVAPYSSSKKATRDLVLCRVSCKRAEGVKGSGMSSLAPGCTWRELLPLSPHPCPWKHQGRRKRECRAGRAASSLEHSPKEKHRGQ